MLPGWAKSLTGQSMLVCGSLLLAALVIVPCGYVAHGWAGVFSASVAGATCLVGGLLAWMLVGLLNGPSNMVPRVLLGMFPRTGLPLAVSMVVYLKGGALAEAGFVYYILAFYFVILVVETLLQVSDLQRQSAGKSTV